MIYGIHVFYVVLVLAASFGFLITLNSQSKRETRRARSRSDGRNNTTGKDLRRVFSSSAVNIFT